MLCFYKNVIYLVTNKNIYIFLTCVMHHIHPNAIFVYILNKQRHNENKSKLQCRVNDMNRF